MKVKLRIISPTDRVHYLVPAEQAQALEVLAKTTYKDVPTCKEEIKRMTSHKGVVQIKKRDWEDNIGTVFFSDDHAAGRVFGAIIEPNLVRTKIIWFDWVRFGTVFLEVWYNV